MRNCRRCRSWSRCSAKRPPCVLLYSESNSLLTSPSGCRCQLQAKMLWRERSQESFGVEDLTRCGSAGGSHIFSEDALRGLDDDGSCDGVDIASGSDCAPLFMSPTDLYFHQKLLR